MQKSDLLFLLVLATIPIQLSKFLFLDYSYVLGLPIDYRALKMYASDIAILLFLTFTIRENYRQIPKIIGEFKWFVIILLLFNIYILSSTIFSISKEASLIFNLRVAVYSLLSVAAAHTISKKSVAKWAATIITISLIWQSLLIFSQFILQKSLGLWILGERTFSAQTPTIANALLFGQKILRPYGTFPHPNVAGAYLALGLMVIWSTKTKLPTRLTSATALALTFSRTAITTLALTIFLRLSKTKKLLAGLIATIAALLFGPEVINSIPTASIAERILLIQASLDIALKNPAFGIGSNNFIMELAKLDLISLAETRLLQPVHNVFLLILAENGIIGLLLFATLMLVVAQNVKGTVKTSLFLALLLYATFDHFLWTLAQGQMMFWLTIAFIISKQKM